MISEQQSRFVSSKNKGYLNRNSYFCQVEIVDISIAVLVLGWVGSEDI